MSISQSRDILPNQEVTLKEEHTFKKYVSLGVCENVCIGVSRYKLDMRAVPDVTDVISPPPQVMAAFFNIVRQGELLI